MDPLLHPIDSDPQQPLIIPDGEQEAEESEDFAAMLEESFRSLKDNPVEGKPARGRIVKITADSAFVDLGGKSEGIIDLNELRDADGVLTVAEGDVIEATVVGTTGDEGALRLSRTLARGAHSRDMLMDAYRSRLGVEGKVTSRNKGGYEVLVSGMKAFCPLSQIDRYRVTDPDQYLNGTYTFRITEVRNGGRDIVLSRGALLKEEAEQKAQVLRETLKEGDILTGKVRSVRDFGVFVDLGGIDGMVHISELSWGRLKHPSELVREGDTLTVQVLKFDRDTQKLSLSVRQMGSSPWEEVGLQYVEGGIYTGKVVRLEPFGAFIEIAPGLEGLLHISNMVWDRRIRHPRDVVQEGDVITVQLLEIDLEKRRLGLGMKQLHGDPWSGALEKYPPGTQLEVTVEKVAPFGVFATLEPGVTGLIPNSEMSTPRGADHGRQFPPGHVLRVQVLETNLVERRISLSRKAITESADREDFKQYQAVPKPEDSTARTSLGTLGDLMSSLRPRR